MENIIEQTRNLLDRYTLDDADLASSIDCFVDQLSNLRNFSFRRYVEEKFPELKGDEYVHQVSLLVKESQTLYDPLQDLITTAHNQYLEQLSSDLDKVEFPFTIQKCVQVDYPDEIKGSSRNKKFTLECIDDEVSTIQSKSLFITLPNEDYDITIIFHFGFSDKHLAYALSYKMNKRDASLEKKVNELCGSYDPHDLIPEKLADLFSVIQLSEGLDGVVKLLNDVHSKLV